MVNLKRVITLVILFLSVIEYSSAQEIVLNKYLFGEGLTFSGKDNNYKFEINGYLQPFLENRRYLDNEDENSYNRFRLRRARINIAGSADQEKFTYRLQLDLTGGGESDASLSSLLFDAWIAYDITKRIKLTFGQKGTPTDSRELSMRSNTLQLVDRSPLTTAFGTIREFGVFAEAKYKISKVSYIKPEICITNGDGINVFDKDHGGFKYGGRIDYLPFGLFNNFGQYRQADLVRELTPKFVIGINYSYNVGISDRRGSQSGTILYLDDQNKELLPDYVKYGVDFLFKYKGFSMLGEYIKADSRVPGGITQRVRNDGTTSSDFLVNGIQDVENYVKGRMMVGEGFNIQGGYVFKNLISVDGRFAHLKPQEYSFLNNATFYNRSNYFTLGITKYLARNYGAKIQLDCTYINAKDGSNDINGNLIKGDEFLIRLITTITF